MFAKFNDYFIGDPRQGVTSVRSGNMELGVKAAAVQTGQGQPVGVPCWRQAVIIEAWNLSESPIARMGYIEALIAGFGQAQANLKVTEGGDQKRWEGMRCVGVNELESSGSFMKFRVMFQRELKA